LRKQSKKLRAILDRLNACVVRNPALDPERDPEGTYGRVLADLRVAERGLFLALFNNVNAGSTEAWVAAQLKQFPPDTQFTVYCGDSDVSIPWGFLLSEPIATTPQGRPSLKGGRREQGGRAVELCGNVTALRGLRPLARSDSSELAERPWDFDAFWLSRFRITVLIDSIRTFGS